MGTFSIWHGLILIAVIAAVALPAWLFARIFNKAGLSPWWALIAFVPLFNLIALWSFAFSPWPNFPEKT